MPPGARATPTPAADIHGQAIAQEGPEGGRSAVRGSGGRGARLACAAAVLAAGMLGACSARPGPMAAKVNDQPIPAAKVDEERRYLQLMHQDPGGALDELIDQALILQEGRRLGVAFSSKDLAAAQSKALEGADPEILAASLQACGLTQAQWSARVAEAYEADAVVAAAVRDKVEVSRQEVQDHYWENLPLYRKPERRVLRQIFTRTRARAEGAMRELEMGEPFPDVAASQGQGPEASKQGLLGAMGRSQLPQALAKAAWSLKPGTYSRIVASHWGYHILYYESWVPAESDTLDEAAPKARVALLQAKEEAFFQAWLARLRESAVIERLGSPGTPAPWSVH